MSKIDLHLHSTHSKHPSEWFLRKIGAQESYTEVEDVYRLAKERGMDYVTLTDHNTIDGALQLVAAHPDDCFVSVEATAYFPEDGCKIHVLVYDITPEQFEQIQMLRINIYQLRDYLREQDLACSVAHATYSVNGRLKLEILEKLMLLFDVFEGINGARTRYYNTSWVKTLQRLAPNDIERLRLKYNIEPWGEDSWIKGFTAGSDDHAGLMMGRTYTTSNAGDLVGFIQKIKAKETIASGRCGDHKSLAFAIYKIAYDYSREKTHPETGSFLTLLNTLLFEEGSLGLKNWIAVQKIKRGKGSRDRIINAFFQDLVEYRDQDRNDPEELINKVYDGLANLSDNYFAMIAESLEKDLKNGNAARFFKNASAALPVIFMTAPFFSTLKHLYHDRQLIREMQQRFQTQDSHTSKRILWFSDTVADLNGVAVTMRELAWTAFRLGKSMQLVTCLTDEESHVELPPNTIKLPCIYSFTPEFYNAYTLRVPSLLKAIDRIAEENPDEIVISTPGPVGLVGLAAAKLLDIKVSGVYHTDFTRQADMFIGDEWVSSTVEAYSKWFFKMMDEVRVPTNEYIHMLAERGLDASRMKLFRRGIESSFTKRNPLKEAQIRDDVSLPDGLTLLWAGRMGKEKNLDFLMSHYEGVLAEREDVNLLIAGDGPERERMEAWAANHPRVRFVGRVDRHDLSSYYRVADVFVFPSTTDTFGMVVLEAQACGLPALVTNVGGPQEIVYDGETGFVLPCDNVAAWVDAVVKLADLKTKAPEQYVVMRRETEKLFDKNYGWENVLNEMLGEPNTHHPIRLDVNDKSSSLILSA